MSADSERAAGQPAPYNLLRLSFNAHSEYVSYEEQHAKSLANIWRCHEMLGDRESRIIMAGMCDICDCQTTFSATPQKMPDGDQFQYRMPWWSGLACACKMSTLDRSVLRVLLDGGRQEDIIYHVGHYSMFRQHISERMPNVTSSQYEEGRTPGEIENGIRYEDLTGLTFADGEFDSIICMEVLEHVPDYRSALREMARVLKPKGRAILTFPWLGGRNYEHLIRAEILSDGSINHILPPEYHGDPASAAGILSFRAFGWKILDEIREAGFSYASANFVLGSLHGYMTLLTPVIVGTR
jgi:SAM-dependent methyltransferase